MIGEILDGRYEILRLLGRGGMGAVYEARHAGTQRQVAVKVIDDAVRDQAPDSLARFDREARAAGSIDSQHIAQVLDLGACPITGRPYMVMEYLDGEDLQHLLDRVRVLPPDVALRIAAQVCRGLSRAHAAGVVHRDVKPAILFLARRDEGEIVVKILDFGIAKLQRGAVVRSGNLTETGSLLGSPRYLAPEQARASKSVDPRADLWSLGVVLYRALSGHTVHEATTAMVELLMKICTEPPLPVQDLAPWVLPEAAAVVERALRIAPDARYPSADAMLDDLRPLLPGGFALRQEMLAPLDASARAVVAPRLPPTVIEQETMSVTARSANGGQPPPETVAPSRPAPVRPAVLVALAATACLAGIGATLALMPSEASRDRGSLAGASLSLALATGTAAPSPAAVLVQPPPAALAPGGDGGAVAPLPASAAPSSALPPPPLATAARPAAPPPARRPAGSKGFDPSSPF